MNVVETEWWTLVLPPEWWADSQDDGILIGDRDDVGCIEISTLHKEEGEFTQEDLEEIAGEGSDPAKSWQAVALGEFRGFTGQFVEEDTAIREWYVANGPVMLFVTYSCDLENRGMDDASVDEILDTLLVLPLRK
jgi:hypothetical protein